MKKADNIIHKVVTAIFSFMILAGAAAYFINYEMASEMFVSLGVPTELVYPLAVAKILGVIAIWFIKTPIIKLLAYIGFALDFSMAIIAHLMAGDGGFYGPILPFMFLILSFVYDRKISKAKSMLTP